MVNDEITQKIDTITNGLGAKETIRVKKFFIGKGDLLDSTLIYVNSLVDKKTINENLLKPLMSSSYEDIIPNNNPLDFICKKYIPLGETAVEKDINNVITSIKQGKAAIIIKDFEDFIIVDVSGGEFRPISDPTNESSVRGPREGFVENIETNISIIRRSIKDSNLVIEKFTIGRRSQTNTAIVYIKDIADKNFVDDIRNRINSIDVDSISASSMIDQYIEDSPYSPFPQSYGTERPDTVKANLLEGRVAIIMNGTPNVLTIPAIFIEFFQGVEDYYIRTVVSSFTRLLRVLATFTVITLPSIYLVLIGYSVELLPLKFVVPIVQSRQGIPLPPFLEILLMESMVEFLREGGLRLPSKIGQTISIVGGIIIGNAAVEARIVSPTTLLIIGISVVASFLIPNYDMSVAIRFIRFPMLILADALGFLGIAAGYFILLIHLFSLKSYGVPYLSIKNSDLKDIFIRAPLWRMNKRPETIPNNNGVRQTNFKNKFKGDKKNG